MCTKIHNLIFLLEQVKLAWELKQKQLKELATILTHENYTETGLATGNDSLADTCKGLDEYIDNANKAGPILKILVSQFSMAKSPGPHVFGIFI